MHDDVENIQKYRHEARNHAGHGQVASLRVKLEAVPDLVECVGDHAEDFFDPDERKTLAVRDNTLAGDRVRGRDVPRAVDRCAVISNSGAKDGAVVRDPFVPRLRPSSAPRIVFQVLVYADLVVEVGGKEWGSRHGIGLEVSSAIIM